MPVERRAIWSSPSAGSLRVLYSCTLLVSNLVVERTYAALLSARELRFPKQVGGLRAKPLRREILCNGVPVKVTARTKKPNEAPPTHQSQVLWSM